MRDIERQRGMSGIGMMALFVIIAFAAIVAIKIIPIYLENFNIVSSLKSLQGEVKTGVASGDVKTLLLRRFQINDVTSVSKKDIKVVRKGSKTTVIVDYEVRKPLFGNIAVVVSFDERVVL